MNIAYLSLGSNLGNRKQYIESAVNKLNENENITVKKVSSIYETEPVGFTKQNKFLNIVVEIETSLEPLELLRQCQKIENDLGRVRIIRWGPRTIDIDIIIYEDYIIESNTLTIPHPRMKEREFVLIPLNEIASDINILGIGIGELIKKINTESVKKIGDFIW